MVVAILLYFVIKKDIYKQIDTSLLTEKTIIQDQIEQTNTIPDFEASFGHQIEVRLINRSIGLVQRINDTLMTDTISGNKLPFRHLFFAGQTSKNRGYIISIFQTLSEKKELLEDIGIYMFLLFFILFVTFIVLNYIISRRLWNPFYLTVDKAEKFDIQSDKALELPVTNIKEFQKLSLVIDQMTKKMRNDYLNLKEYNENAAHEIQTPLAIIRSKLEILMQRKELKKDSLVIIKSINEATSRLYKLNQGLLLISKIDNLYFKDEKDISLKTIVENTILSYKEILQLKNIEVMVESDDPAIIKMNEVLAEVLVSNLISNAVRYNIDHGFIKCRIDKKSLSISNTGRPLKTDPELLFRRFNKEGDNPQSVGLGLSIVKKISDTYKMNITYTYSENIHILRLDFNSHLIS